MKKPHYMYLLFIGILFSVSVVIATSIMYMVVRLSTANGWVIARDSPIVSLAVFVLTIALTVVFKFCMDKIFDRMIR